MANRSLNKVLLLGNLTRDPDLRYTPNGTPVITFSVATNRRWKTQTGEFKDEAQFHRIVAWSKLAELLGQFLQRGTRVLVEGRLQYRKWTDQSGVERQTTEIVASDVIVVDRAKAASGGSPETEPDVVEAAAKGITTDEDNPSVAVGPDGKGTETGKDEKGQTEAKSPASEVKTAVGGGKKEEKITKEEMPF